MEQQSIILIVDDDPGGQDALELLLANQGYRLIFATNGWEALAKAIDFLPDLILLDVMMPGMDGLEVCQRLRAMPRLADVPIVMVTALDDRDSLLAGLEAGADDFISKPFDRIELRTRIRTITRLNRYRRLQAERARLAWVVEQTDDGYLILGEQDEIGYANRRARLYLNLPPESTESISETFIHLVRRHYSLQPDESWATWPSELAESSVPRYLIQPESPTSGAFWLQVNVFTILTGPEVSRIIQLRDITAQMGLQGDMRGFHVAIRHKLRTPLISLINGMELLARHTAQLSPAEITELAVTAHNSAKRLHHQIEDVLQYTQTSSLSRVGLNFSLDQLSTLLTRMSDELNLTHVTADIETHLDGLQVRLSLPAMELILRELLENAQKFHPTHTPVITVQVCGTKNGQVKLLISNDGPTLSPQQLAQVWLPYYQGEKYFTGEVAGMGLGLPVVAFLVWSTGGKCQLYNRSNQNGVVVELTLPLANEVNVTHASRQP